MSPDRAVVARRAIPMLDLTNLDDDCREDDVVALCDRARSDNGPVAAVCVWPRFAWVARSQLAGTGVHVATVVNFPEGLDAVVDVVSETTHALDDGADEIDVVIPYRALLGGDDRPVGEMVTAVRDACPEPVVLKAIIESGELRRADLIATASRLAIGCGADFVKTSTGKTPVGATLAATATMLVTIRNAGRNVGLKPSGGIRTLDDAAAYLQQADETMGAGWATPATFRFGASSLLDALEEALA
jgi:deoxyribose-phosphate aldolase